MFSPTINHSLLSRSEVVSLVNTLHRFTESLHAVNNFRKMWAEAEKTNKQVLLDETAAHDAPKVITSTPKSISHNAKANYSLQPKHSPTSEEDIPPTNLIDELRRLFRVCKDGTVDCVRGLFAVLNDVVSTITGLLNLSKSGAPRTEF